MSIYDRLISEIFHRHEGATQNEFEFNREEMGQILREWGKTIKNLGDVPYSYRGGRRDLPDDVTSTGYWVIEGRGKGRYAFRRLSRSPYITIPPDLKTINVLDATPDIILKHSNNDEQGLLSIVRYNRLVDIFLGITAYHLQSHVRAYIEDSGQVEIDDLYLGVDADGTRYVIPIEAKTADEPLGLIQIANLNAFAQHQFPNLTLQSVAVKFWSDNSVFFIAFNQTPDCENIEVTKFKRYRLIRDKRLAKELGVEVKEPDDN
jgi:hypothetical protein